MLRRMFKKGMITEAGSKMIIILIRIKTSTKITIKDQILIVRATDSIIKVIIIKLIIIQELIKISLYLLTHNSNNNNITLINQITLTRISLGLIPNHNTTINSLNSPHNPSSTILNNIKTIISNNNNLNNSFTTTHL